LIECVLEETGGNQLRAAEMLGLNRNTLRKKISELTVTVKRDPKAEPHD
jgi:two-component system nitrogen regulation response regulator GlnG